MVSAKMMNQSTFDKFVKELNAVGEFIKTRQDEKQSVLNQFDKEKARYSKGRISQETLASSVRKTNAELIKLDKSIRFNMAKSKKLLSRISDLVTNQSPKVFRAKLRGLGLASGGKKAKSKKKRLAPKKKKAAPKRKKSAPKKSRPKRSTSKKRMSASEIKKELKAEKKLRK